MRILMINVVCGIKSTGRICTDIASEMTKQGNEVVIAYGRGKVPIQFRSISHKIGNAFDIFFHGIKARLFDGAGFGSRYVTKRFVHWIEEYNPDIIHVHNLHGYYINIEELFEYFKSSTAKVLWTMHDCWAFTGHCVFFDHVNCEKWKNGCDDCIQRNAYPTSFVDCSRKNYNKKREMFNNINKMEIVVPSMWLKHLVENSFLADYKIRVIHNGIDTKTFKPVSTKIHQKLKIENQKIVLGVAAIWNERKGLDDLLTLAKMLDESYVVVIIGLSRKQISKLPKNVVGIERTDSIETLREYYSAATVYVNPTYDDNYPTTNIEAISCGTPVITYDTGGSGESAKHYGMVLPKGDVEGIYNAICSTHILDENFDCSVEYMVEQYIKIYSDLMSM